MIPRAVTDAKSATEPDAPDIALAVMSTESNRIVDVPGIDSRHVAHPLRAFGGQFSSSGSDRVGEMGYTVSVSCCIGPRRND